MQVMQTVIFLLWKSLMMIKTSENILIASFSLSDSVLTTEISIFIYDYYDVLLNLYLIFFFLHI